MFRYTVGCIFSDPDSAKRDKLANRWLDWLREGHIQDVVDCGAEGAEIVSIDGELPTFEIRYRFPSRETFETYERDHAPRLRKEGAQLFPHELGLKYLRSTGEIVG